MKLIKSLFPPRPETQIPPMPSCDEIIEIMQNKQLEYSSYKVVSVISSKDKSKRYIVLKDKIGHFTYQLERIYQFDESEWKYACSFGDKLPALWEPYSRAAGKSFFENIEELLKELRTEAEYKQYFE